MITITIDEITSTGTCAPPGPLSATFAVPASATGTVKKDRITFKVPVGAAPRIPTRGRITVSRPGLPDQVTEYKNRVPELPSDAPKDSKAPPPGTEGAALETFYPGYAALPGMLWAQLNLLSDDVVVQLKLEKLPPATDARNEDNGEFYVYGATLAVVHAKISEARRVLDI